VNQVVGVQGRIGKIPDSCYTFWVGASIKILTGKNLLNEKIDIFLKLCYNEESCNFSKYPNGKGDPLHTLHSCVGMKILTETDKNLEIIQGITLN
jgi:geranylgeranyl transferase type-1 subunit beta